MRAIQQTFVPTKTIVMKRTANLWMNAIMIVLIATATLSAQQSNCILQGKNLPENDCAPCSLNTKYNIIVQNLLEVNEVYRMEEELNKMVDMMDAVYKTFGNLKQKGFDELDMNLKKRYEEAKDNPQRAMELISWMEGVLEKAGCNKKGQAFDTRSEGVSTGGLQTVSSNATSSIRNLTFPNYQGAAQPTFDCCENPRWQPNDILINSTQQLHNDFVQFKKMFEDFKLMHMVQINAVQMAVFQFQKYDSESKKKMEQLTNQSFCNAITNMLSQSGAMSAKDAAFLNSQIKQYCETNDMLSLHGAVKAALGEDAALLAQFLVENYTATDLLGNFGDIIKNNPTKMKALQGLSSPLKGAAWLSSFMNLVSIAEASVNVFFDTFMKLGGNSFVIKTQNELWCVAAQYYYYALQSVLANAAALNNMKSAMQKVHSFFPNAVIPLEEMNELTAEEAQQKISSMFGSKDLKATLLGNQYTVQLPNGKQVVFVLGKFFCGKYKSTPKAEVTPDPKQKPVWSGGFICGTGWSTDNAAMPLFSDMNTADFVQQHQTELNTDFKGITFAKGDAIRIRIMPSAEAGLGFGCAVNHTWGVCAEIVGGWQKIMAETDVRVARLVIPTSPSQPPSTQQFTEQLYAASSTGFLRVQVGPQASFGNNVKGFAGAGLSTGFTAISKIEYTAGEKSFEVKHLRVVPNVGGYINIGVQIPIAKAWSFRATMEGRFTAVEKKFVASPGLNLGVEVSF